MTRAAGRPPAKNPRTEHVGVRVTIEMRERMERAMRDGERLTDFVETAIRRELERREGARG